jgi:protein phosphatase
MEEPVRLPTSDESVSIRVDAAGLTHPGRVRQTNEDSYLIATLQRSMVVHDASPAARGWFRGEPAGTLLVVADGMGGQGGGDLASRVAVNAVASYLLNVMPWVSAAQTTREARSSQPGVREQLSSALVVGDETVKTAGAKVGVPKMGTTLTVALLLAPFLYVAHVGDTRCYLQRGGKLRQLTTDHNLAQKLASDSKVPMDPPAHLQNILWNALGADDQLPQPELRKLELVADDRLLLCSDGLSKHVSDAQISAILGTNQAPAERAHQLVELANAGGGTDNVTVLVAHIHGARS